MTQLASSNSIEPWQLTAYALNELEPSDAVNVERALEADAALRLEFEQIQQTLSAVRTAFASTMANVGLNDSQTAVLASQIEQMAAPSQIAPVVITPIATTRLVGRPFYRRKRFAALLATAAAIPIAATWMPSLFENGGPFAVQVPGQTLPSPFYLDDQVELQRDQFGGSGMSLAPEPRLAIVEEHQQDLEKTKPVIAAGEAKNEIVASSVIAAAERRHSLSEESLREIVESEVTATGGGSPSSSDSYLLGLSKNQPQTGGDTAPLSTGGSTGGSTGATLGSGTMGGSVTESSPKSLSRTVPASAAAASAVPSPIDNSRILLSETKTLAIHDKRLRDMEDRSAPLNQLPSELQQNVPHLFRAPATESSGTDRFETIVETQFIEAQKVPLSTFSIDVDTASYSKIRQTILEGNRLPTPSMVRIEEMVNYFEYAYAGPQDERPFSAHMSVDRCPWNTEHQLVRVGLQAKKMDKETRVKANIVFLLDVSGSMNSPNKLPLVKKALSMMVNQLTENDRVAIVVYAGAAGCVLPSTSGADKQPILSSLDHLNAGGSTNGGQGIQLAYSIAKEHFIPGGANRVVLCTDGDFNVGVTGDDALVAMMQENAKSNIFLTCLGFGAGNYNDTMMEKISNKGNGIYGMIDNELEARRMMVEQLSGTLVTVAKDVKIQVDFNPAKIAGYRLIGYEDRRLANKDFDNDQKDAGEIGAGHRVTALYEVIPAGKWVGIVPPSEGERSKYLTNPKPETSEASPTTAEFPAELLTLKVRYKEPEGNVSTKQEFVLKDTDRVEQPLVDRDMQWATSVAEFGLLLRRSEMAPQADWNEMLERAASSAGGDAYRLECLAMMRKARSMFPYSNR